MTKIFNLALIPVLVLHLWLASQFELAHDEAYYWLYSQKLDWGYFDHPPVVGVLIRMFSFLPHSEVTVRLGFVLLQIGASLLLTRLVPENRKSLSLLLFFAFPLASFAGLLALPDMPLLFMAVLYCLLLKRYLEKADAVSIGGLAVTIAMLLYSKYHGILLIFFTILALPKLLLRKDFYLVAALSLILFLPHILWQYQHDFSTLRYHFFERPKSVFSTKRLVEYSLTQVGLAGVLLGPIVWWKVIRTKVASEFERALKWICIGTFFFFFISTFSKKFEANWTIFLTAPLIILASSGPVWERRWVKGLLYISVGMVFFPRFLFALKPEETNIKRLREFHGWKKWAQEVETQCGKPVLANTYQIASKLSFYLNRPVHALNYHSRKNQFDYWTPDRAYYQSTKVCYITDKSEFGGEVTQAPDGKRFQLVRNFSLESLGDKNP